MLHLDQKVQLFLKWIRGRTRNPTNNINAFTSVDLEDATLKFHQEILKALVPPPPPTPMNL